MADELVVPHPETPAPSLTARELELAILVVDGLTNTQIAERLHLSSRQVTVLVGRLYRKVGVLFRFEFNDWAGLHLAEIKRDHAIQAAEAAYEAEIVSARADLEQAVAELGAAHRERVTRAQEAFTAALDAAEEPKCAFVGIAGGTVYPCRSHEASTHHFAAREPACRASWCRLPKDHRESLHDIPFGRAVFCDRPAADDDPDDQVATANDGTRWHVWDRTRQGGDDA